MFYHLFCQLLWQSLNRHWVSEARMPDWHLNHSTTRWHWECSRGEHCNSLVSIYRQRGAEQGDQKEKGTKTWNTNKNVRGLEGEKIHPDFHRPIFQIWNPPTLAQEAKRLNCFAIISGAWGHCYPWEYLSLSAADGQWCGSWTSVNKKQPLGTSSKAFGGRIEHWVWTHHTLDPDQPMGRNPQFGKPWPWRLQQLNRADNVLHRPIG